MEVLNSKEAVEEAIGWPHKPGIAWEPKDWTVDSLTGGCFSTFTRVLPPLYYQATGADEQDIPQQGTWAELHELAGVLLRLHGKNAARSKRGFCRHHHLPGYLAQFRHDL